MGAAGKAAIAAVAALIAGLIASFLAAAVLRSATPEADQLWKAAPTGKVAIWALTGAHGAPVHIKAGAGLSEEGEEKLNDVGDQIGDQLPGEIGDQIPKDIGGTFGDLLGGDEEEEEEGEGSGGLIPGGALSSDFDVRLAPLTLLALAGLVLALVFRMLGVGDLRQVAIGTAAAALVYGGGLASLAAASPAGVGFDLEIVKAGVDISVSPIPVFFFGSLWGALFAAAGGLSSRAVAAKLSVVARAVAAGMKRAAIVAVLGAFGGLIVLGLTQLGGSGGPSGNASLSVVGGGLLFVNLVAGAIVMSHGASMNIAMDVGPFAEWSRLGYLYKGSGSLSPARWLFVLVPIGAGFAAGRVMRKYVPKTSAPMVAGAFGAAWGVLLAILAALLRIDVVSSFAIGALNSGGNASISPIPTLLLGLLIGTATSYAGMVVDVKSGATAPPSAAVAPAVVMEHAALGRGKFCGMCGLAIAEGNSFCSSCGLRV